LLNRVRDLACRSLGLLVITPENLAILECRSPLNGSLVGYRYCFVALNVSLQVVGKTLSRPGQQPQLSGQGNNQHSRRSA
jgi:hypothetical protein